jgi:hypothetical protein
MRILLAFLLLSVGPPTFARSMFVVVHTIDGLVVNYRCVDFDPGMNNEGVATRSVVRSRGHVSWHVVGGVPPYTVIRNEVGSTGSVCVTVIDAAGNVASGCGVVGMITRDVEVNCGFGEPEPGIGTVIERSSPSDTIPDAVEPPKPRKPLTERDAEVGFRTSTRREPGVRRESTGAAGGGGVQREFPVRREVTSGSGSGGGGGVRTMPSAPQRKF